MELSMDKSGLNKNTFSGWGGLNWYANEDTFYGLSTLFYFTDDKNIENILTKYIDGIELYIDNNGLLPNAAYGLHRLHSRTPLAFVEGLMFVYKKNGNSRCVELAKRLTAPWLNSNFFLSNGLFPHLMVRNEKLSSFLLRADQNISQLGFGAVGFGTCTVQKFNTNFCHGILELWKATGNCQYGQALQQWISAVEKNLVNKGWYMNKYNIHSGLGSFWNHQIMTTISVLGVYADFTSVFGDQSLLKLLERRAQGLISKQTQAGFFPSLILNDISPTADADRGWLDVQTDATEVLLKVYSLTQNDIYLKSARTCIDSVIGKLSRRYGHIEYFDAYSGADIYHDRVFTKYVSLVIKALLLLDHAIAGDDLYADELVVLSGDR
jgi:hypothetical protein